MAHTQPLVHQGPTASSASIGQRSKQACSSTSDMTSIRSMSPGTVQSYARSPRPIRSLTAFGYVIIDEAHYVTTKGETYKKLLRYFRPRFHVLGLTATPDRAGRSFGP